MDVSNYNLVDIPPYMGRPNDYNQQQPYISFSIHFSIHSLVIKALPTVFNNIVGSNDTTNLGKRVSLDQQTSSCMYYTSVIDI